MAILYDPVGLDDAFGKVMIGNLNVREDTCFSISFQILTCRKGTWTSPTGRESEYFHRK